MSKDIKVLPLATEMEIKKIRKIARIKAYQQILKEIKRQKAQHLISEGPPSYVTGASSDSVYTPSTPESIEEAEELVQETMLNIWRKSKQFNPEKASASTWIYTIARNLKIDAFRRNKRPTINIDDIAEPVDNSDGADRKVDLTHRQHRVADALAMLPPEQCRVVQMSFFEDKSHGEISEELNIPLGTVKSRMRLAFERIRNHVGDTV